MSQRCVVLIGMMGAGKSEVGKELAERLGYTFIDTDRLVEKRAGKTVARIFADDGEPAFRQMEREAVATLRGASGHVIALGGGTWCDPENRTVLAPLGLTVYLKASARELHARVKNDSRRPLLRHPNPLAELTRILKERERDYERAELVLETEDLSVEEVVDRLIDELAKRTVGDG